MTIETQNRSLLVIWTDDPYKRAQIHGFDAVVLPDGSLELFHSGQTGSPALYANRLNQADPKGYPVIVFDMDARNVQKLQLVDFNNGLVWDLSRPQCTDQDTGVCSFVLSYTKDVRGRVGMFVVPTHLADKVCKMDAALGVTTALADVREIGPLDYVDPTSFDHQMMIALSKTPRPTPPIYAGVVHACADAVVAIRAESAALRADVRAMLMGLQESMACMSAERRLVAGYMAQGITPANRPEAAGDEEWVVHPAFAKA